jgi:hypothetical protein
MQLGWVLYVLPRATATRAEVLAKGLGTVGRERRYGGYAPFEEAAFYFGYLGLYRVARGTAFQEDHFPVNTGHTFTFCRHRFDDEIPDYVSFSHKVGKNTHSAGFYALSLISIFLRQLLHRFGR